jgi:phosphate transport system permease protein
MDAQVEALSAAAESERVMKPRRPLMTEGIFRGLTLSAAGLLLASLAGIALLLVLESRLSIGRFGIGFITSDVWNPVKEIFGAVAPVYGTLVTSLIAMIVGVPLALGVAFFLAELCPFALRGPLSVAIELLAAVPSIIFGMWGLFVLAPFLATYVQPALISVLGPLPVIGALFQGPPFGIGMLTAGLILGVMILPYIAAVARQVIATVPPMLREAAFGVGATRWEVFRRVLIPYASRGLMGGIMLGLGRALGETMAVTFVIGNAHHLSASLLAPGTTISAALANEFTEAESDLYQSSLLELGLILFVITFIVLAAARFMLSSSGRKVKI